MKSELRKKAKLIRNSLDMEKTSAGIINNILKSELYQKSKHVMLFYPLKHEVNLLSLLKDGKNFYLPKVCNSDLLVCPYKQGDELVMSEFNTQEPATAPIDTSILDIVFVPALMADKNFNRLGYGGGFYDRFLSKKALNAKKIVAIPSGLITKTIPYESFDEKIDVIISEKFIFELK